MFTPFHQLQYGGAASGTTITVTDIAQGSDSIAQILAGLTVADSGLGLDEPGPLANSFTLSDSGAGTDTVTLTAYVPVTDTGAGADAIGILQALLKTVSDLAVGSDAVQVSVTPVLVADVAAGADLLQVQVALSVADLAQGTDAIGILQALLKVVTDTATGVDSIAGISVAVPMADSGQGLDIIAALTVAAQVVDAAQGFDAVVRITGEGPARRIVITFAAKKPAIDFGPGKKPGIIFN